MAYLRGFNPMEQFIGLPREEQYRGGGFDATGMPLTLPGMENNSGFSGGIPRALDGPGFTKGPFTPEPPAPGFQMGPGTGGLTTEAGSLEPGGQKDFSQNQPGGSPFRGGLGGMRQLFGGGVRRRNPGGGAFGAAGKALKGLF